MNTAENPADIGTRGMTQNELKTSSWFTGPKWLTLSTNQWPNVQNLESSKELLENVDSETRKSKVTLESVLVNSNREFDQIVHSVSIQRNISRIQN